MSVFIEKANRQTAGAPAYYVVVRSVGAGQENGNRVGQAIYDPARGQFAFIPDAHNLALTASEAAEIVASLNGLSK